jgi:hypothetical protein
MIIKENATDRQKTLGYTEDLQYRQALRPCFQALGFSKNIIDDVGGT